MFWLGGLSRDYLMSAHVVGKSPNSLALKVPLLACASRVAAKTGLGELVYFFPLQSPVTPIPDRRASFSISNTLNIALSVTLYENFTITLRVPWLFLGRRHSIVGRIARSNVFEVMFRVRY